MSRDPNASSPANRSTRRRRQATFRRRRIGAAGLILALIALAATGLGAVLESRDTNSASQPPRVAVYSNPVLAQDFPDPHVMKAAGGFAAFSTNAGGRNVPVSESDDLVTWTEPTDALPQRPAWMGDQPLVWAPAVSRNGSEWVLFVSGPDKVSTRQCIGTATSRSLRGPFNPSPEPIVCQRDLGGSIDPFVIADKGHKWLLWKNDGNCCGLDSWIWSQRLANTLLEVEGEPVRLLGVTEEWEQAADPHQSTIENPAMFRSGSQLFLLYSANGYATAQYSVGYATCESPGGPCTKNSTPLLTSSDKAVGPGGGMVFTDQSGRIWIVYHAWAAGAVGYEAGGVRTMRIDPVVTNGAFLSIEGPTEGRQVLAP